MSTDGHSDGWTKAIKHARSSFHQDPELHAPQGANSLSAISHPPGPYRPPRPSKRVRKEVDALHVFMTWRMGVMLSVAWRLVPPISPPPSHALSGPTVCLAHPRGYEGRRMRVTSLRRGTRVSCLLEHGAWFPQFPCHCLASPWAPPSTSPMQEGTKEDACHVIMTWHAGVVLTRARRLVSPTPSPPSRVPLGPTVHLTHPRGHEKRRTRSTSS
ncbi:hypothetical protein SCP_0803790 [Sparassis crispa]|uniref:Uncharacterized protein n=1 Tax=Sparassis crispa TaxID=139825 RepID=A0A401GUE6_9APHY|nr:hypothetical protein SCP_0803790 [Sparassis crispa]GBE85857.1 hypothetical protein SCP_0803790 [Sparassis crispa]